MASYLRSKDRLSVDTRAYLYKWTHIPTQKWYVGSRTAIGSHPGDGYYCSSKIVKPMIEANPEEWAREVLAIGAPLYIRELEGKYLVDANAARDEMSFNQVNADGKFHRTGASHTDATKEKLRIAFTGSHHSPETCEHFSKIRHGEGNPFYGKHHSDETKKHLHDIFYGIKQTPDQIAAKINRQTGVPRTDKAKSAISQGIKSLSKKHCEHCGGEFSPALYGRWHGDKCKNKNGGNNE